MVLAVILVVATTVVAAYSLRPSGGSEGNAYVQSPGDYVEWSTAFWLNVTMVDTDGWNDTPQHYLENGIDVERVQLIDQIGTNITLAFWEIDWTKSDAEDIVGAYHGLFPSLQWRETVVWDNGTRWYAPCPDPRLWDPNWTFATLPDQEVLTKYGRLDCQHYSLSIDQTVPGIPGITPEREISTTIEWWLFHGILVKMYRSGSVDGIPDGQVGWFYYLRDTNISIITGDQD